MGFVGTVCRSNYALEAQSMYDNTLTLIRCFWSNISYNGHDLSHNTQYHMYAFGEVLTLTVYLALCDLRNDDYDLHAYSNLFQ